MTSAPRLAALGCALAAAVAAFALPTPDAPAAAAPPSRDHVDYSMHEDLTAPLPRGLRDVMWVGNNWDGTASIVDARTFEVLKKGVNLIPDKAQELRDIRLNPVRLALFLAIRVGPGEGHDQFV